MHDLTISRSDISSKTLSRTWWLRNLDVSWPDLRNIYIYIKITLYIQNTYICLSYDDSSFDSLCFFDYIVFPVHKRGKSG